MSKPRVFISYRHRDAELARKFATALERLGFEANDTTAQLQAGDDWGKAIQSAIKKSDAVVMVALTPQNLSASWMSYEAGIAEALGKRVMLLLPNKYPAAELPADFASTPIVEIDPHAPEGAAHDIASRLASVV